MSCWISPLGLDALYNTDLRGYPVVEWHFILVLCPMHHPSVYDNNHTASHLTPFSCCLQVRQELVEEYEQVKSIVNTLESFKMDKPVNPPSARPEEYGRDPAVWPPPTPAEHRYSLGLMRWAISSITMLSIKIYSAVCIVQGLLAEHIHFKLLLEV